MAPSCTRLRAERGQSAVQTTHLIWPPPMALNSLTSESAPSSAAPSPSTSSSTPSSTHSRLVSAKTRVVHCSRHHRVAGLVRGTTIMLHVTTKAIGCKRFVGMYFPVAVPYDYQVRCGLFTENPTSIESSSPI